MAPFLELLHMSPLMATLPAIIACIVCNSHLSRHDCIHAAADSHVS